MTNQLTAALSVITGCDIQVTDQTNWNGQFVQERSLYHLYLWWKDPVTNAWTLDSTNPLSASYLLNTMNNGVHTVEIYAVEKYSTSSYVAVTPGQMYSYNGQAFVWNNVSPWVPATQTALGLFPSAVNGWVLMSVEGSFHNYGGTGNQFYTGTISVECTRTFDLTKTSCHNWRLTNNYDITGIINVDLYNLNDPTTIITSFEWNTSVDEYIDVEVSEDGIFELDLSYVVGETTYHYPRVRIRDICGFLDCMVKLVKQILCNEKDPCCQSCSEEQKRQLQIWRDHLNMMIAYSDAIQAAINIDLYYCMNNQIESEPAEENLQYIIELITKLNELTDRCGECYGAQETEATQPCKDC